MSENLIPNEINNEANYQIEQARIEDLNGIAKVHVDTWRTTYRGHVPDRFLDKMEYEKSEERFRQKLENLEGNQFFYVVKNNDGKVIGFADGGKLRGEYDENYGEVGAIYVLEDYQGKGIGQKLLDKAIKTLKEKGFEKMLIWVLATNNSKLFYEKMGGVEAASKTIEIDGVPLKVTGYA